MDLQISRDRLFFPFHLRSMSSLSTQHHVPPIAPATDGGLSAAAAYSDIMLTKTESGITAVCPLTGHVRLMVNADSLSDIGSMISMAQQCRLRSKPYGFFDWSHLESPTKVLVQSEGGPFHDQFRTSAGLLSLSGLDLSKTTIRLNLDSVGTVQTLGSALSATIDISTGARKSLHTDETSNRPLNVIVGVHKGFTARERKETAKGKGRKRKQVGDQRSGAGLAKDTTPSKYPSETPWGTVILDFSSSCGRQDALPFDEVAEALGKMTFRGGLATLGSAGCTIAAIFPKDCTFSDSAVEHSSKHNPLLSALQALEQDAGRYAKLEEEAWEGPPINKLIIDTDVTPYIGAPPVATDPSEADGRYPEARHEDGYECSPCAIKKEEEEEGTCLANIFWAPPTVSGDSGAEEGQNGVRHSMGLASYSCDAAEVD